VDRRLFRDFAIWLRVSQGEARYKVAADCNLSPYRVSQIYNGFERQRRTFRTDDIDTRRIVGRVKGFKGDKYNEWMGS